MFTSDTDCMKYFVCQVIKLFFCNCVEMSFCKINLLRQLKSNIFLGFFGIHKNINTIYIPITILSYILKSIHSSNTLINSSKFTVLRNTFLEKKIFSSRVVPVDTYSSQWSNGTTDTNSTRHVCSYIVFKLI